MTSGCLLAIALTNPVRAEETSKATFEEIIVTARSQKESLMQVPVAVTAISAADISRYSSTDLLKLAQTRPDTEVYTGGSRAGAAFIIRGVGTTADTAGVESSVSINIDGTQTHRPRVVNSGLFDLQQVEIMKGPQALFFGKNSSAGVISISSADPTNEVGGYVKAGYEFEAEEKYVEAALNMPINDKLALRFAGQYHGMRGWIENIAQARPDPENPTVIMPAPRKRWNGSESFGGRVTILWRPTDNYTSKMKFAVGKYEDDGPTKGAETICGTPTVLHNNAYPGVLTDCKLNGITAINDLNPLYTTGPVGDQRWNSGVPFTDSSSALITWQQSLDLGNFSIHANTGFSKLDYIDRGNYNFSEFQTFSGGSSDNFRGWSQEVRIVTNFDKPINFTVGGFYEDFTSKTGSALYLAMLGPDLTTGSFMSGVNQATEKSKTVSGFGQVRWNITSKVELAGGARWTQVKKSAVQGQPEYVHYIFEAIGALLGRGQVLRDSVRETNVSPEVSLTWHPDTDTTLYGAFKTGYKVGGIAQPALVVPANAGTVVFDPEKSLGGEVGYKSYMLDRRLRFSATAFYYKFKGLQLTSFDPLISSYRIKNAANVKQYGVELEADYRVTDKLTLRSALNYTSVTFGPFANAPCFANQTVAEGCVGGVQDLTGHQLNRAPKWAFTGGFSYDTPISESLNVGINADVRYRSSTYTSDVMSPFGFQKSYALLNAGIRLYKESPGWELAFIGSNLTNKRLIGFVNDRPGAITPGRNEVFAWTIRPRELAIQATYKF